MTTYSDAELEAALSDAVNSIWNSSARDDLTVNLVRKNAESKLGLESGFFASGDWHKRSRDFVKDFVSKLEDDNENEEEGKEEEEEPARFWATNKRKATFDNEGKSKRSKKKSDDGAEAVEASETKDDKHDDVNDSDSDVSSVIDEPLSKRGSKAKASPKAKVALKKVISNSADAAEIKKLQSQLIKCGVRKMWANELKQYGEDEKAKLRHLKDMLKDIGMTGRFSEVKAREIKQKRELEADLEEVKKNDKVWGVIEDSIRRGGRSSRRAAPKSFKIEKQVIEGLSDSEEEDDEEDDDNGDDDSDDSDDDIDISDGISDVSDSDESEAELSDDSDGDVPKKKSKKKGAAKKKAAPKKSPAKRGNTDISSDADNDDDSE